VAANFRDVDAALQGLTQAGYVASRELAVVAFLMDALERPLLVEGPAGVGKTELAKALSQALERPLLRLQCYEGLDESRALYEWEYGKQLLYTEMLRPLTARMLEGAAGLGQAVDRLAAEASALFDGRFLLERPLLAALRAPTPALLLVDEVDRADPEFEALLLEVLSDFQVSIPELGTVAARHKPRVVLTSNGSREMSDALRRRCLYLHLDYPEPSRELAILQLKVPQASDALCAQIVSFVERARKLDLKQRPSVAESVDWARTLVLLSADALGAPLVKESLAALAKQEEDRAQLESLLGDGHEGV
jgi:MoxR-like ATPase